MRVEGRIKYLKALILSRQTTSILLDVHRGIIRSNQIKAQGQQKINCSIVYIMYYLLGN